jgi:selenium metabolism protein YedF
MGEKRVDARGKACPQPVILTRDAIREGGAQNIRVIVDSEVAAQNVQRMAKSESWEANLEQEGADIHVVLTKAEGSEVVAPGSVPVLGEHAPHEPKVAVFIASDVFGVGEEELGRILMNTFLMTLKDIEPRPSQVIFVNSGVRLSAEGSALIDVLAGLEATGTEMLSCGTCLDYYGLVDMLRVGRASNMYEIVSALLGADRVVRP